MYPELSEEQELFIRTVLNGYNVLVNACIGSGKTTSIQELCNRYMAVEGNEGKKILYLTYNKLLKLDARGKISRIGNVTVTNYHGFAYTELGKIGIRAGTHELIQAYNKKLPPVPNYSLLIIDEYQDIEEEFSIMLNHIKDSNPDIQIVVVGDMEQKIYDKTRLDVARFISEFLGPDCYRMEFTKCFRIRKDLAGKLGEVWGKKIVGVNEKCRVFNMSFSQAADYLVTCQPKDILCLGQNAGQRSAMLNYLEKTKPKVFNKNTVWSNVSDNDSGSTQPTNDCAIFTTYDGCKGIERNVCVVFDWTEAYWNARITKPDVRYEIIRNIFCVAASRGKYVIIFITNPGNKNARLSFKSLMGMNVKPNDYDDVQVSKMFDFKYVEDVEKAFEALEIKQVQPSGTTIAIDTSDGLIDLSSCIGIYQEAAYFNEYDISKDITQFFQMNRDKDYLKTNYKDMHVDDQILYLVSLETNQDRYMRQVSTPFVTEDEWKLIENRLSSIFTKDELVQKECTLEFMDNDGKPAFMARGFCDVIKERLDGQPGNAVYELKFVEELSHTHFLQCACYMVALNYSVGYLWNVRDNQMYQITIPDRQVFLDRVAYAITKGHIKKFMGKRVVRVSTKDKPKATVKKRGTKKAMKKSTGRGK